MAPHSRGSPKAVVAAALVTALIVACDTPPPTSPAARTLAAPSRALDPGQEYTGDPNDGCWIAPDSSVFEGSPTYGGIYPYTYTRCGVSMNVWWPGFSNGVDWPYTGVFNGNALYDFPWGHRPGSCCGLPPETGFSWTITFSKAVRNVIVYTRFVDYAGGKVKVKGAFGNLIAEKTIPIRPNSIPGRDTVSFADTNVYIVEIIPDRDPSFPPDAAYPDKREFMGWQAQFEPPPAPPLCILDAGADSVYAKAFNDSTVRREMENMLARSDTSASFANRHEEVAFVHRNADGTHRVEPATFTAVNQCSSSFTVPLDPTIVAVIHTHPFRDGQTPGCPGAETKKYEPTLNGGGSDGDFVSKLATNFNRQLQLGGYQIPYFIIDLDRAWFNPPQSLQGEPSNRSINRAGGPGCRWT